MERANDRKSLIGRDGVMVSPICASWNQVAGWLRLVEAVRRVARRDLRAPGNAGSEQQTVDSRVLEDREGKCVNGF